MNRNDAAPRQMTLHMRMHRARATTSPVATKVLRQITLLYAIGTTCAAHQRSKAG